MPTKEAVDSQLEARKLARNRAKAIWDGAIRSISETRAKLAMILYERAAYIAGGGSDPDRIAEFRNAIEDVRQKLADDIAFAPAAERKYYAAAQAFNNSPRT
jgi:hypothetical protein